MTTLKQNRTRGRAIAALLALATTAASHAAPIIDWLTFRPGADRTHFDLLNDAGLSSLQGQIHLTSGFLAPLSPGPGTLQSAFWNTSPPAMDSVLSDGTVSTTKVQVAPQAGAVNFQLAIQGPDLSGMVFAVGQLFAADSGGTREMGLIARTLAGVEIALEFLAAESWDNGVRAYAQPVNWDGIKLTLDPTARGESQFAFFRIQSGMVPITSLLFDIPNGYAVGAGDALEFAFGIPVPEPGVATLALLGSAGMTFARRTRKRVRPTAL